ncbi:Mor transcription activator family protein [Zoogloea sp.]|uniref:Mor transcription activator family protein n=1 Tax=Zoogloea sp. TaxID=49181 RepID=UPI0025DF8E63|nr:Mor transcription activator family protein [Zoogloea sp.]MCK6396050.1 hypothetical protein [Zoogloea sp.]
MLPPIIEQLVSLIGIEAVQALVEARLLGYRQRVGRSRDCEWWREWSDVVGDGAADTVMQAWAGEDIYFPACYDAVRLERNRQIVARYDALIADGTSARRAVRQLCRAFRLSDRQIESIVNRPVQQISDDERDVSRQLGLF